MQRATKESLKRAEQAYQLQRLVLDMMKGINSQWFGTGLGEVTIRRMKTGGIQINLSTAE